MVIGYSCPNCGFKHDCDIRERDGHRACPDCGIDVTGITTRDFEVTSYSEPVTFSVHVERVGKRAKNIRTKARTHEQAYKKVNPELGEDEYITQISTE